LGFQHQADADHFLENLQARLRKFGLELHPDKTRLVKFGRYAEQNRERRGEGKPETFDRSMICCMVSTSETGSSGLNSAICFWIGTENASGMGRCPHYQSHCRQSFHYALNGQRRVRSGLPVPRSDQTRGLIRSKVARRVTAGKLRTDSLWQTDLPYTSQRVLSLRSAEIFVESFA
jgi:hypothetical protein